MHTFCIYLQPNSFDFWKTLILSNIFVWQCTIKWKGEVQSRQDERKLLHKACHIYAHCEMQIRQDGRKSLHNGFGLLNAKTNRNWSELNPCQFGVLETPNGQLHTWHLASKYFGANTQCNQMLHLKPERSVVGNTAIPFDKNVGFTSFVYIFVKMYNC